MIYITGDMHNTIDMSNISTKKLKNYCYCQKDDYNNITYLIILGDFGLPWFDCPIMGQQTFRNFQLSDFTIFGIY